MNDEPIQSVHLTLTPDGATLLMSCLDLAVKQGGLNAAAQILPLALDIKEQLQKNPSS